MFYFTVTNTDLLIHLCLLANSFTMEAFGKICCMRGCIIVTEHHFNTTVWSALAVISFSHVEHCSNTYKGVLSVWILKISKTCYPLTIKVTARFNCISYCVPYSLFPLWVISLGTHLDENICLKGFCVQLLYHYLITQCLRLLSSLQSLSLFPCECNIKRSINIEKWEIRKKENPGHIFWRLSVCLTVQFMWHCCLL